MAAPVININTTGAKGLTLINAADATGSWAGFKISGGGATPSAVLEQDIFIEGSAAISVKISGSTQDKGVWVDNGSGIDFTVSGRHLYIWAAYTTVGSLNTQVTNGLCVFVSTTGGGAPTDYLAFAVGGSDVTPDARFIRYVIDLNKTPSRSTGTTNLASVRYFGIGVLHTGTVKSENLIVDAVYYGDGLQIEAGDSTTPGSWEELFQGDDTNKYGIIEKRAGVYFLKGGLTIGDPAGTVTTLWEDTSGAQVVFENPTYYNGVAVVSSIDAANLYQIELVGNATGTTDITWGEVVGTGDSRQGIQGGGIGSDGPKWTLDGETDIADLDTVNLYGMTLQGAGVINLSGSTKTDAIGCTFVNCDEVQPNDAEFLNNTIIAPVPDRGLEMVSGHNIKQIGFIAGALDAPAVTRGWQVDISTTPDTVVEFTDEVNSATANDITFFPATTGIGDYFALGDPSKFGQLTVDVGTIRIGGSLRWRYWNGSAWANLAGVTDGTNTLSTTGVNTVTWTVPTDWASTSISDESPLFYVMIEVVTVPATNPLGDVITIDDLIEHHLHLPSTTGSPFTANALNFFGHAPSGAPKWHGENNSGGDITINTSNDADPAEAEFDDIGVATTSVVDTKTVTITVEDKSGVAISEALVTIHKDPQADLLSGAGNAAGDADLVVSTTPAADQPTAGWNFVLDVSENVTLGYRYVSYTGSTFTFGTEVTGATTSEDGTDPARVIKSTSTNFLTSDIEEGDAIRNTTDGSYSVVDEIVDADTIHCLFDLKGGTDNTWQSGDSFSVNRLATALVNGTDIVAVPLLSDQTDGSGEVTLQYAYQGSAQAVIIRARKSMDGGSRYISSGDVSASIGVNGLILTIQLDTDGVA